MAASPASDSPERVSSRSVRRGPLAVTTTPPPFQPSTGSGKGVSSRPCGSLRNHNPNLDCRVKGTTKKGRRKGSLQQRSRGFLFGRGRLVRTRVVRVGLILLHRFLCVVVVVADLLRSAVGGGRAGAVT